MRKDKGLNGDLDRQRLRPTLDPPYRWPDWAAKPEGITGDELISFMNNEDAIRPDGTKGSGLFAYLRGLQGANGGDRRALTRRIFSVTPKAVP
jgi:type I restriction enzyme M protein